MMRQLLAVAVLGSSLAFTASAALAADDGRGDKVTNPVVHPWPNVTTVNSTDSARFVVAGGSVPATVFTGHEGSNR